MASTTCMGYDLLHIFLSVLFPSYDSFLQQFESVSFGDPTFASFVLLPMQQCHPVELRRDVWGEHHHILRSLFIPMKQVKLGWRLEWDRMG